MTRATETLDTGLRKFQFRKKGDTNWTDAPTTTYEEKASQGPTTPADEGDLTPQGSFKATLTGLTPETENECRMVYADEEYSSEATGFTTEAITPLYNGNFDIWSQSGETIYPDSSQYAGHTTSFWNTSNPGTAEGAEALFGGD